MPAFRTASKINADAAGLILMKNILVLSYNLVEHPCLADLP